MLAFDIHEVSLLTILYPEGFDCVTGRSDMICDICAICGKLIVIRAMYVMWAGRHYVMGRKAIMLWAGRSAWVGPEGLPSRDGSPLRLMGRKVRAWKGVCA